MQMDTSRERNKTRFLNIYFQFVVYNSSQKNGNESSTTGACFMEENLGNNHRIIVQILHRILVCMNYNYPKGKFRLQCQIYSLFQFKVC